MPRRRPQRSAPETPVALAGLHELAQSKVQAALAGLSQPDPTQQEDPDPVVQQALERMRMHLGELDATDRYGRPVSWAQIARIVIGPLADRVRDADTAGALMDALAPITVTEPVFEPAPESAAPAAPSAVEPPPAPRQSGEQLTARHLSLGDGGHRYIFRAEERLEEFSTRPTLLDALPPAEAHDLEERLLAALERRFPDPGPMRDRAHQQGVGWPDAQHR